MSDNKISLKDGSRIAIVGGGPAGSFFANFALRLARLKGIKVHVTVFEGRDFSRADHSACNMSVGVMAERLMEKLDWQDITVPRRCIQSEIKGYQFFTQDDYMSLEHPQPGHTPRIISVFRGGGPVHSDIKEDVSFDHFLLKLVEERGAQVIKEGVKDIVLPAQPEKKATLIFGKGEELEADLVVGAFGVNSPTADVFTKMRFGYLPPKTLKTCIVDAHLGRDYIKEHFRDNIYVFAFGTREVEFASLTPKGDYLTIGLVGKRDISTPELRGFLNHPVVKRVLPQGTEVLKSCCICFPRIPVGHAYRPYWDRVVVVGDAGISRSYKNGIESAFVASYLATNTIFERGLSREALRVGYYDPAIKLIARDNFYGKIVFKVFGLIASQRQILSERLYYAYAHREKWIADRLNAILWNLVTGDAPYKEIFQELFHPRLQFALLPVTLEGLVGQVLGIKKKKDF
jgi:flavin-dependent dehydrogenase